jgi:large subunit ribosomal protein L30
MAKGNQAIIRIRWIRSGIAFNRKQAVIVRALGLRRLHQVVERQDTPVVRGLIAKVQHLVEVVGVTKPPAWTLTAEYTIVAGAPAAAPLTTEATSNREASAESAEAPEEAGAAAEPATEAKPKRRARATKPEAASEESDVGEAKD